MEQTLTICQVDPYCVQARVPIRGRPPSVGKPVDGLLQHIVRTVRRTRCIGVTPGRDHAVPGRGQSSRVILRVMQQPSNQLTLFVVPLSAV